MHGTHNKLTLQKRTAAFLYVCAGVLILTVPHLLSAAGAGIVSCTGLDCQFCSVAQLIQNVINFLIQLSIPLSAALFAYAGFLYATAGVSGKSDQINKARGIFSKVGGGFIFTLIDWLVINTFLSTLLGGGPYANGKWFEIPCVNNRNISTGGIAQLLNGLVAGTPNTSGSGWSTGGAGAGGSGQPRATTYIPGGGGINGADIGNRGNALSTVQDAINAAGNGGPVTVDIAAAPGSGLTQGGLYRSDELAQQIAAYAQTQGVTIDPSRVQLRVGDTCPACADVKASADQAPHIDVPLYHAGQTCGSSACNNTQTTFTLTKPLTPK